MMKKLIIILLLVVSLKASTQSGINWNVATNISTNVYDNMHPRIVLDAAGNPLIIWGRASDESVFFSRWNGTTFTTPIKLNPAWLTVATASWMGPDIASHGDTVYVVVKRTPEATDTNHIYIMRSFNGGKNFSAPVRVDFIADSISRFPTVTTDASGNPIVAFMKFNSTFGLSRWVVTKSSDFGNTFSTDVKASGWGGATGVCDCCPGAVLSNGNVSAVLYRNNMNNIRDTWASFSNNNGSSFTNGFNVDNKNWLLMSCPASGPDGVIIGDTVYSVFMNGSGAYRTYISKSVISGMSVKSVNNLTGPITGLSQQNYPRISNNGNAVAIVWSQTINGTAQLPLLFTNNINKGFPPLYDSVVLADITNADVAVSDGKVFVVWEDDNSGTVKYRSGTFISSTAGIEENISENLFSFTPNPATNNVSIHFTATDANLTVTNSLGKEIFSQHLPGSQNNIQLNTSKWDKGIFFITLQSGKLISTKKFILQ
jgi:hypothetical protein